MKAIQLEQFGIDHLELVNIPLPTINENEVLVKTSAVSLQYLDLIMVEGNIMPNLNFPHIPVSEGMGIVEEVGKNVTRWKKGDRVLIPFIPRWESGKMTSYNNELRTGMQLPGTLSEFTVQPENTLVSAPRNLTDEESASLSVAGLTAWSNLVSLANIKAGQTILIQGSGGVSLFALQIAKAFGLKVIATTGSKEKEAKLKALGADEVINYNEIKEWSSEVIRLNDGIGVDLTLDVAGNQTIKQSILSCKENAYVGLVGFMSGGEASIDIFPLIMNYIRLQGYSVGNAQELTELVHAIEKNNLKPVIDSVFPIEKTKEAFLKLKSGKSFGKIIIKF
ncbi:zinc-dependent alcohol dehydrogenase family protein [Tenacibaculum caenipelagi]|uniref:NADPH:quinone reductase-like Zn-dependent oxidoreductase n=1 Tax=Tenacibaculum caenipelagi TaxID=1325435 RepID=A0A4R6TAF5_9FLAO|nr:NAD(P)-dependent alcohol dehydrogenase [Tenacibaculum caenipelagi]TDQ23876.1 NADPH:quinone reductase-like Zn-dependent oxidoreductase [Tenacibaculum caenipelagi]